jgi:hypothetical protein
MNMALDLLIAIIATASAAIVIASLVLSTPASIRQRIGFAVVLAVWFFVAVALAATGIVSPSGLGTPAVGLAVVIPIVLVAILASRHGVVRDALDGIPLPIFIAVNIVRVFGIFFVIHYAGGRLPAPFAPSAGWGDVAVGIFALPVALIAAHRVAGWKPVTLVWNVIGIADLVIAVGLGVTSAADSPFPIFTDGPDTRLMAELPMFLIPGFLVPLFVLTHLAVFVRLTKEAPVRAA